MDIWQQSILPTLFDRTGRAIVMSNTNGVDPQNFFWRLSNQPEHGFKEFHAPTHGNPLLPKQLPSEPDAVWLKRREAALEKLQKDNHPLVYRQEYLAEFVDWSGVAFFALDKLLVQGNAVPDPVKCDIVFAVVDTAVKTGKENDGTAVTYFALTSHGSTPLVILDWDIQQIEGALLETWLPTVFQHLEHLAKKHGARQGSAGVHIEDKSTGMVLLQQAKRRNWLAEPISTKLTAMGKDERAISVSGYHYRERVKISATAYDKVVTYKGVTRNHLVTQVVGFRVGDKEAAKRADDLLDTYCYGLSIALGNTEGW
jgi:hypothetical protein